MLRTVAILTLLLCLLVAIPAAAEIQWSEERLQYMTIDEYEKVMGISISQFREAPVLAAKVAAGQLLPVEQRIPKEPAVLHPTEEIGQYGGTYRRGWGGPGDHWSIRQELREGWVYVDLNGDIQPNVPKAYEISEDGATFTFFMREGMRWSDGEPVTAHDSVFWWEIKLDDDMYHPHRQEYLVDGQKPLVELVDDYTWKITFPRPHPTFLEALAMEGRADLLAPKHYLKNFHAGYADPEELAKLLAAEGLTDWTRLFNNKYQIPQTTFERPVIWAWYPINHPSSAAFTFERNPYYWKVDPAGNQLPYIDRYVNEYIADRELYVMKVLAGDLSLQWNGLHLPDYPVLMANRSMGNYAVTTFNREGWGASPALMFNLNHKDSVKQEVFGNAEFRKAMSLAIDREEINEMIYLGLGVPQQAVWGHSGHGLFYYENWAQAYAEYDPVRANEILDQLGLERRADGIRLFPDGRPMNIYIENSDGADVMLLQLLQSYWEAVGVKTHVNTPERSLYTERVRANEFDIAAWPWWGFNRPDIRQQYPLEFHQAPLWVRWWETNGREGQEPPAELQGMMTLLEKVRQTFDLRERQELLREWVDLHIDQLYTIGAVGELPRVLVISNKLGNAKTLSRDTIYDESRINYALPSIFFR